MATSVAGRGLDVPTCRLVVNYSAPNHLEDYVHRVGRTGRAGRKGTAYTLVNKKEESAYAKIVAKALTDAGWGDNVPQELKDLAGSHDEKVEKGEAKSANRGYGGRGFTYDSTEQSEKQVGREERNDGALRILRDVLTIHQRNGQLLQLEATI